jgi:hypothetical protein
MSFYYLRLLSSIWLSVMTLHQQAHELILKADITSPLPLWLRDRMLSEILAEETMPMNFWQRIFAQSKVNGDVYDRESLPTQNWKWPETTWHLRRLRETRRLLSEGTTDHALSDQ